MIHCVSVWGGFWGPCSDWLDTGQVVVTDVGDEVRCDADVAEGTSCESDRTGNGNMNCRPMSFRFMCGGRLHLGSLGDRRRA